MFHPSFTDQLPVVKKILHDNGIKSAYAFGSVVSDKFNIDSDIDLLVTLEENMEPVKQGKLLWDLHDQLRAVLGREIDILIEGKQKNLYFIEELNEKKQLIYAA